MERFPLKISIIGLGFALSLAAQTEAMTVNPLRCEYLNDPLGIDVTAPRLSWWDATEKRGDMQTAYQILVASTPDLIYADKGDLWDTGKVSGSQSIQVEYAGKPLGSRTAAYWKVRVWDKDGHESAFSSPARWEMGLMPDDWKAQWIGMPGPDTNTPDPAPFVRRTFTVSKHVKTARLYASAQGLYLAYVNGHRLSEDSFNPGFTDYHFRTRYQTFDVTHLLHEGANGVGAMIGDGWYVGHIAWLDRQQYGKRPMGLLQLEIEYTDGTRDTIASGPDWKVSTGPILNADFMKGESYDATKELGDWSFGNYNDSAWTSPSVGVLDASKLQAQNDEPVLPWKQLHPRSITHPSPGVAVIDLGQNMVGYARLKVNGKAGDKVQLRFAEMLNPDGTIYTANLRGATSVDTYTCKGGGEEIYEPHFTFHGFRYVEVSGYPGDVKGDTITGIVLGSATPDNGKFECSDAMVNKLWHNIYWGQRGNYLSIPTDCPQRDERMGWMGDAQVFCRNATYNCDIGAFMTKWTYDVNDGQTANGSFCDVSPRAMGNDAAPAWGDAGVIVPYTVYEVYDDKRLLERCYPHMKAWVDYIHGNNPNLLWDHNRNNDYGDWLNIEADMPRDVLATAYFAHSTDLVARAAAVLGKEDDAATYGKMYKDICAAFDKAYVSDGVRIKGDTQTCYLLALSFGLLPEDQRALAVQHLVDNVHERGDHLSTGFLGVKLLNTVLTDYGHVDLAYKLLLTKTFPSWMYPIENGATTIWERWDGWTKEKGFQDPGMNSFNHYSLGSVGEWLYSVVGGIGIDKPGFKEFILRPRPGGDLKWANTSFNSSYGPIVCNWKRTENGLNIDCEVPANSTALVYIPAVASTAVTEGGKEVDHVDGIEFVKMEDGSAVFRIGSGKYSFKTPG